MKYKIKVGEKYLVGENPKETLKGTVAGDTTAVFSRAVGEMSAYDFSNNIEGADAKDCVTACDYIRGLMDRQGYGFYLGEIKLIDADAEETVVHCNLKENAEIIAHILEFDSQNMVYDWYEQHIANTAKYYEGKSNSPENPDSSAVDVVRCKDCRYFYDGYDEKCCINHRGVVMTDENGFCHHAERKAGPTQRMEAARNEKTHLPYAPKL